MLRKAINDYGRTNKFNRKDPPRYRLHESSADNSPNRNTTDVYRGDKGVGGLGVTSGLAF